MALDCWAGKSIRQPKLLRRRLPWTIQMHLAIIRWNETSPWREKVDYFSSKHGVLNSAELKHSSSRLILSKSASSSSIISSTTSWWFCFTMTLWVWWDVPSNSSASCWAERRWSYCKTFVDEEIVIDYRLPPIVARAVLSVHSNFSYVYNTSCGLKTVEDSSRSWRVVDCMFWVFSPVRKYHFVVSVAVKPGLGIWVGIERVFSDRTENRNRNQNRFW